MDNDLVSQLKRANHRGLAPPQNWTHRAINEIERLAARIDFIETRFRHIHVNNGSDDTCKECGLDLRDAIHTRITTD